MVGRRQGGTFVKPEGQVKPRVEGGVGSEQGRDWFLHRPGTLIWSHSSILSFEGTLFSGALFQQQPGNQSLLRVSSAPGSCWGRPGGKCTGLFQG